MAKKKYIYDENLTKEENLLLEHLYTFNTSQMAVAIKKQFLNPNENLKDFHTRISDIINYEWQQRQQKKLDKLFDQATLKYPNADFDEALYEPDRRLDIHMIEQLQRCGYIREPRNLLITGSSGTGKTHIANALCIAAMHQFISAKYIRANTLLQLCVKEEINGTIYEYINELASYDLLVIDDFGLMDLNMDKCRHLFEVIETRDSRKSTIIVSQFPVLKWWDLFQENTYADAVLSRMTKQAYRLECNGRDMRQSN